MCSSSKIRICTGWIGLGISGNAHGSHVSGNVRTHTHIDDEKSRLFHRLFLMKTMHFYYSPVLLVEQLLFDSTGVFTLLKGFMKVFICYWVLGVMADPLLACSKPACGNEQSGQTDCFLVSDNVNEGCYILKQPISFFTVSWDDDSFWQPTLQKQYCVTSLR